MQKHSEAAKKFETSRKQLLLVVLFSAINVLLVLFRINLSFLFSASFPLFIAQFGQMLSQETGGLLPLLIAAMFSFSIVFLYWLCYVLAKKYRVFILVALILFSIDTLFLIWSLTFGLGLSIILDVAFHAWVMYYLIIGTKAWSDLKKLPFDEPVEETNREIPLTQTPPLRHESTKGKVIFSQIYENLNIVVKRTYGTTELIVNGIVFAEKKGLVEINYTLDAYVENTYIKVTLETVGNAGNMELYVNGILLAKKTRYI